MIYCARHTAHRAHSGCRGNTPAVSFPACCAADDSGQIENCVGAKVELAIEGAHVGECVTDDFGDFKFDGLPPRATYQLHVGTVDGLAQSFQGVLEGSRNLGSLFIKRAVTGSDMR